MSYDINVIDPQTKETRQVQRHEMRGGTYAVGGSNEAWLNITYNYSKHYYPVLGHGLNELDGKTIAEVSPALEQAVKILGTYRSLDYWEATPGNAGAALSDLLSMFKLCHEDDLIRVC